MSTVRVAYEHGTCANCILLKLRPVIIVQEMSKPRNHRCHTIQNRTTQTAVRNMIMRPEFSCIYINMNAEFNLVMYILLGMLIY